MPRIVLRNLYAIRTIATPVVEIPAISSMVEVSIFFSEFVIMSEEIRVEIAEVTPTLQVEIKTHAPAKVLTQEERQEIYAQLSQYSDIHLLPLPEDFFDDDVVSDRGLTQLQYDAHRVGLLNKGMLEMSKEKEEVLRKRLAHKIELIREMTGLKPKTTDSESALGDA